MTQHTLVDLNLNETAEISCLSDSCHLRLMELGFMPGTTVTLVNKLPFGGPLTFDVEGCKIAMRRDDASAISVSHGLSFT